MAGKTTQVYEVDPEQFKEIQTTIYNLLDKVFGHDESEDPNVEFILIDRERNWPMHFTPLPYDHKEGADLDLHLDLALMNLGMAMTAVSTIQNIRTSRKIFERDDAVKKAKRDGNAS